MHNRICRSMQCYNVYAAHYYSFDSLVLAHNGLKRVGDVIYTIKGDR